MSDPTYLDMVRARQAEARTETAHDLDGTLDHQQRVQAIVDCGMCDEFGYQGDQLCYHRTFSTPETRAAAKETLRVALERRPAPEERLSGVLSPADAPTAKGSIPRSRSLTGAHRAYWGAPEAEATTEESPFR